MSQQPKPGAPMVAAATVVVAACMVATAAVLAPFAVRADLCAVSLGMLLAPYPVVLGLTQYVATSRRSATGARAAAVMLILLGAMTLPALVALLAAWIQGNTAVRETAGHALAMALVTGLSLWAGALNFQWSDRIRGAARSVATEEERPTKLQFSLADLLLLLTAVAVITGMLLYIIDDARRRFPEHSHRAAHGPRFVQGARHVLGT
jgi:hypothetical protein